MEHNIDLIKQIREAYAKEEGYSSFANMALNVNIVPRDLTEIAKRYAEGMIAALQSRCDRYEKALREARTWVVEALESDHTGTVMSAQNDLKLIDEALKGEGEKATPTKQWWEGKAMSDMPEYVQVISTEIAKDTGTYCKVFKWSIFSDNTFPSNGDWGAEIEGYEPIYLCRPELNFPGQVYGRLHVSHLLPATAAEYNAYLQTLTVK
jgi:hypothetical protein